MAASVSFLATFSGAPVRAQPSDNFVAEVLAAHNEERAATGVPTLVWNEDLARDAADWANTLKGSATLHHAGVQGQGENLWMGTRDYFAPATMVGDWIAEKADFRAGRFPNISLTGNWSDVGHYTQIIWRNTREVGCAVATDADFDYLVCRYFPAGNWMGEYPLGGREPRVAGRMER